MTRPAKDRICVGQIKGTRGLKGELRLRSFTDDPKNIGAYGPVETEDGETTLTLKRVKVTGHDVLAFAEGIETREAAEALRGTRLFIDHAALPPPDDDEFYYADLVGLNVEGQTGNTLGKVVAVQNFGGNDLLEVKLDGVRETALVPFTEDIVPLVDIGGGKVVIDPPDGLLELAPAGGAGTRRSKTKRR